MHSATLSLLLPASRASTPRRKREQRYDSGWRDELRCFLGFLSFGLHASLNGEGSSSLGVIAFVDDTAVGEVEAHFIALG